MTTPTPMLQQYHELKRQHPGTLLFFRLGDFYELFYDDAVTGARELQITLTARHKERGAPIPMCGVPHHAAANHIARLIRKGYRVAICEQTEDPSKTKKLMRREVVRVITPGTAIDPQLIEANESVYLAAVCGTGERMGLAFLDLSTGEFRATEATGPNAWHRIRADIESYEPRELLFPASLTPLIKDLFDGTRAHATRLPLPHGQSKDARSSQADTPTPPSSASDAEPAVGSLTGPIALTPLDDWLWQPAECASLLCAQFGARSLEGYNLDAKTEAVRAAGACLYYARDTQRAAVAHITDITYFEAQDSLMLDHTTVRNLELTEAQTSANRAHSLFGVINTTVTGMGARLLRAWLLRPSMRRGEIEARLAAVDDLYQSQIRRDALRRSLREITDLERLIGRINMATATPRDLAALRRSLEHIPTTHQALSDADSSLLHILRENTDEMPDVQTRISEAISDDPPSQISDGGSVRDGYSAELDELREISRDAKQIIASFEARERTRSGISSLRIRFNNISGYFIEVPKASAGRVPPTYERRQTIANAERFTTTELRELERRVLGAETRMAELETSIVAEVRTAVGVETKRLQATARALATLDALAALAETAVRRRYVRPVLHDGDDLEIREARHPVIEALSAEQFVPNDLYMNNSTDRLLIITGPNMGGKCVANDTLLYTDRGLLKIEDLMPAGARVGEFAEVHCQVQSKDGRSQATHFYTGGKQATVKITTRFGYQIEGTPEHRVWVRREDGSEGWKRLEELSVSDTVALDRQVDLWGQQTQINCEQAESLRNVKHYRLPTELDEDLGYMLGLLVGDGTLTYPTSFTLTTADDFIADEYRRIINKHFGCHVGSPATHINYRVSSKQIRVFLESLGLGYGRAHEKYVPHSILRAPKQIVIAFLQGLFDTDGWAANHQVKVYLATSSVRLAREVQMLLLNLGIVASLRVKQTRAKPCYLISIYGGDAIKFHEIVGFRLPRKQVRQNLASNLRMPNIGIPHLAGTLKGVQQRIVTTALKPFALKHNKSVNSIFYTYIPTHRNISYGKLDELIAYCRQNSVACPELEAMQKRHYFYDTVARVESDEADVYDLNVASDHSYIANGFVSHNSTILRQTALIVILAQMGSFVPATRARLPVLDRIWTRVGASDDLAHGRSTFMVEMTETAAILHNASPRSLVLLDEIGRGTSTFDGLSIAWAVAEHLHDSPQHAAKTLFATHYHELTELAERLPGAQNYRIAVAEQDDMVIFLYRLERGRASKSYGIEVARLAGLPPQVIARARDVLARLERYELDVFAEETPDAETEIKGEATAERRGHESHNGDDALSRASRRAGRRALAAQATLFDAVNQNLLDELRGIDVETFSADDARQLLLNIRSRII